ncbi:hypothetical protein FBY14_11374 [Azospirillum brasilense]|nr:hypothetical protein FBY14_11374 [Azospirillum brasilense]
MTHRAVLSPSALPLQAASLSLAVSLAAGRPLR